MALATDQHAMLKLLLERGQGYPELAVLLGIEESEVRARARRALGELGGADPDRGGAGLTDYLLGQADPIDRADAVRHLRESSEDHRLAGEIAARLRELYPEAELPRLPGEPRQGRFARPGRSQGEKAAPAGRRALGGLSPTQTRTMVILASAAVLVIAVVLAVSGAFGGEDADPADTTAATTPADERAVPVQLRAAQGSDAGGVVVFGFATADQPFIEFQIRQLDPAPNGKAYVLWFLSNESEGFPLPQPLPVQANGTLDERIAVPATTIAFVQEAESIAIALNDPRKLNASIQEAVRQRRGTLPFPGGTVLSAPIQRAAAPAGG